MAHAFGGKHGNHVSNLPECLTKTPQEHPLPVIGDPDPTGFSSAASQVFISRGTTFLGSANGSIEHGYSSHQENAPQTTPSGCPSEEGETPTEVQEQGQVHGRPIPRDPIPQVPYRSSRRQEQFTNSQAIKFVVNGEEGIRLSDALEGNWTGFQGRDDTFTFGGVGRSQIMIRLHVRRLPNVCQQLLTFLVRWVFSPAI